MSSPKSPTVVLVKNRIAELILLLMVCLAPWAFGSVEAWAELGLYALIGLLTILVHGPRTALSSPGLVGRLPGVALAGLALLAVFQALPLSRGTLSFLSQSSAAIRADLVPGRPEQVALASGSTVALPAATLSIDPDVSLQNAARLAAAWLLFHCVLGMNYDPRTLVRFAKVVVFNSVLLAFFAIIQSLTWNGQIYWSRPVPVSSAYSVGGPFLSHNHLAAYLNLGFGLALGLLLNGNSRDILRRDSPKLWTALGRRDHCDLRRHVALAQRVSGATGRRPGVCHVLAHPVAADGGCADRGAGDRRSFSNAPGKRFSLSRAVADDSGPGGRGIPGPLRSLARRDAAPGGKARSGDLALGHSP